MSTSEERENRAESLHQLVNVFQLEGKPILNVREFAKLATHFADQKVKDHQVKQFFREEAHLRFKMSKPNMTNLNSSQLLMLRHIFGKLLVDELNQGKRIINIDESYLN